MKWSPLQLNMLPLIAIETQKAIQQYKEITDIVSKSGTSEDIQLFNQYRSSIKKRISVLDRFYQRKYQDETISLFHMLKLKLQRAIYMSEHIQVHSMSSEILNNLRNPIQQEELYPQKRISYLSGKKLEKKGLENEVQVIRVHSNSKEKKNASTSKRNKTEYYQMPHQMHIEGDLRDSSIHDNHHFHNDTSYDDFQPLFRPDPIPIVNQLTPHKPKTSTPNFTTQKNPTPKIPQPYKKYNSSINLPKQPTKTTKTNKVTTTTTTKPKQIKDSQSKFPKKQVNSNSHSSHNNYKSGKNIGNIHSNRNINRNNINNSNSIKKEMDLHELVNSSKSKSKNKKKNVVRERKEPEEIVYENQENNLVNNNQFKFTIKMTKEEYMSLLAIKKDLLKNKVNK